MSAFKNIGLGALLVLWLGSREVIRGRLSIGGFVAFNAYLAMLPDVVAEGELVDANALTSMNFNIALTVAPLVAGALVAASGAQTELDMLDSIAKGLVVCGHTLAAMWTKSSSFSWS